MLQSLDKPKINCPKCENIMEEIIYMAHGDQDDPAVICWDCGVEYNREDIVEILYANEYSETV
jgi:hypothetical protein